jgi:hypothetical protein
MTVLQHEAAFTGNLDIKVLKHFSLVDDVAPAPLSWKIKNTLRPHYINGWAGAHAAKFLAKHFPVTTMISELNLKKYDFQKSTWVDYGLVGRHVVVSSAAEDIASAFAGSTSPTWIYHGIGSGSTAATIGDTSLETEYTVQYLTDNTRATGTQTKEAGSPQVFETVGTNTVDNDGTLNQAKEHGIFSNTTAGSSGSLLDRTVYAEISLSASDAIQSTYRLTIQAGG